MIGDRGFAVTIGAGIIGPSWAAGLRKLDLLRVGGFAAGVSDRNETGASGSSEDSQFEAVAGDGMGLIAVLSEEASRVSFVRGDNKYLGSIALKVPPESELFSDWEKDNGSRGEGMILLQNGHILLLKEKKPSLLIEFGIAGAKAGGYRPGDAVSGERGFEVPADGAVFVPLKFWSAHSTAKSQAQDLSDLAVTAKGQILALSDQERAIFEVEKKLRVDEAKFEFSCVWNLPEMIEKPEGLVVLQDGSVLVVSDQKKVRKNLWHLRLGACSKAP